MILITGSDGYLGSNILKKLNLCNEEYLCLSRRVKKEEAVSNKIYYDMTKSIDGVIPLGFKIKKIIHLAHDYGKDTVNGENINYFAVKDILRFCMANDIPLLYASSVAAYNHSSDYGKIKNSCEKIILKYKRAYIFRIGMLVGEGGGLIYKLNKFFENLPFFILPGKANFSIYLSDINRVASHIAKFSIPEKNLIYLIDKGPISLIECLKIGNKIKIKIPVIAIKTILYPFYFFKLNLKSFSYDGITGLCDPPFLDPKIKIPTY